MRLRDIMTERFDQPRPFVWDEAGPTAYRATFTVDDAAYWVKAYRTRAKLPPADVAVTLWVCNFGIDPTIAGHALMKPTGRRTPFPVLSTVFAALTEFVVRVKPEIICFSDTDKLRGRASLYDRFARHLTERYGYEVDTGAAQHYHAQDSAVWILRRAGTRPLDEAPHK